MRARLAGFTPVARDLAPHTGFAELPSGSYAFAEVPRAVPGTLGLLGGRQRWDCYYCTRPSTSEQDARSEGLRG